MDDAIRAWISRRTSFGLATHAQRTDHSAPMPPRTSRTSKPRSRSRPAPKPAAVTVGPAKPVPRSPAASEAITLSQLESHLWEAANIVDAELLEAIMGSPDPSKRAKEFEVKLTARLRKHMGNPKYRELSERLEALKERHERGLLNSVEFLKTLLELARELVATEKETPPQEDEDRGKAALTELFQQVKGDKTPVMVERIVSDIDEIVRLVRFPGWQHTAAGEREVKSALRRSLLKYQLHQDVELFDRAFGYIKQYY